MNIIIFDGTFHTTPFINNLVKGLVPFHSLYILGFNESLKSKIQGVKYISLGSNQNKLSFFTTSLIYGFKSRKVIPYCNYLLKKDKKTIQKLNLDYVLRDINPDLIHLQWVSNIPIFESYLKDKSYRFVLSLRGYHINVRPFVNNENANYLREFIPLFKGLHGVSNSMFNQLRKLKIDLDSIICRTIYSGHVSSNITKQDFYLKSSLNIILVGRNHWKKNYSNSLIALRNLLDEDYIISFTFIGLNRYDSEELLFLSNELKLNSNIFFKGNLSKKELRHFYLNSDALLLPSYEEGVANVCIEAMHFGLPVISSRAGGMTELIDKNSGILLDNQNPEGIEQGIKRFLSMDQKSMNEISENACKTVRLRFAESKMIEDFNHFYSDLINQDDHI